MFNAKTPIFALLLSTLAACTPAPEDGPEPDEVLLEETDEDRPLLSEQDGNSIPAAKFEVPADPVRSKHIEDLRASSCEHDAHADGRGDLAAPTPARGVTEPRFRVEEDQIQASLDLQAVDDDAVEIAEVDRETLEAQQRYLAEAAALEAEFVGTDRDLADAKAELKELELSDDEPIEDGPDAP